MLSEHDPSATIAVKDLAIAKRFYESTLGLSVLSVQGEEAIVFSAGSSKLMVYRSQFAGTNQATVATWLVGDDLNRVVQGLKDKGVVFERYDMPNMVHDGDVHVAAETRAAWFKDPDGNIHGVVNR
jgi:catechol-2,3-dioxygenase